MGSHGSLMWLRGWRELPSWCLGRLYPNSDVVDALLFWRLRKPAGNDFRIYRTGRGPGDFVGTSAIR